jgi:hypothetical protein
MLFLKKISHFGEYLFEIEVIIGVLIEGVLSFFPIFEL